MVVNPKTLLLQRLLQNGCENISPQQRDRRSGHRRWCSMQRSSANISEGPRNNEIDQFCREPSRVSRLSVDDGFLFVMSRYRRRIMHRRPTHQADNSVSQKRRRVTLPRAACAAGKHPPREEARWERAEGQEVGVPASISCPGRRPYVPVSLVLGGARMYQYLLSWAALLVPRRNHCQRCNFSRQ